MATKMLTIHLVGAQKTNYPWGFENHLISTLEGMNYKVISTDFRQERHNLHTLLQQKADLVLVCKGEFIPAELIKSLPYPTALWYCEQIGNDNSIDYAAILRRNELAYNVTAFDYVFSHDNTNMQIYRDLGCKNVFWLPCVAVNTHIHKKLDIPRKYDVTFIGSQTPRRKAILAALEKHVKVFNPNVWDSNQLNEIFNASKIVLNIHLSDLLNTETRVGEVLGAGSFLLTEELSCRELFADGKHLVQWHPGDVEGLVEKIHYYLTNEAEREKIAEEGHRFAVEHHSLEKRMQQLLATIDFNKRVDSGK